MILAEVEFLELRKITEFCKSCEFVIAGIEFEERGHIVDPI